VAYHNLVKLKRLAVVDVEQKTILAQSARHAPGNDCATLPATATGIHSLFLKHDLVL
jgi:hypothetical protein